MLIFLLRLSSLLICQQKEQKKRFTYSNLEIIDKLREEKRDIIAVLGHYNNWEWPTLLPYYLKYKTIIIYKPLQNKYFNRFINNQQIKIWNSSYSYIS